MGNSNRTVTKDARRRLEENKHCICSASAIILRRVLQLQENPLKINKQRRTVKKVDLQNVDQLFEPSFIDDGDETSSSTSILSDEEVKRIINEQSTRLYGTFGSLAENTMATPRQSS
mmetsp:Transcript_76781/g.89213  ORF Transcript_76781/g.89213 Transcript_76781/m.89213 type:complete len:117 (+) Transcript_76781:34-384(+)